MAKFRTTATIAHAALSFVAGTVSFVVVITLFAAGVPLLLVALLGLPVLWLMFWFSHAVARFERWRSRELLGVELRLRTGPPPGDSFLKRMMPWTRSRGAWLETLYAGIVLPLAGWVGATLVFVAIGGGIAFVLYPTYGWALADPGVLLGWNPGLGWAIAIHVAVGLAALVATPWLARGVAGVTLAGARRLLEPAREEQLTRRVETLEESRAGMVAAADAERRRIERDLHDGAQQRLVALAMTLGRAQRRFEDDPETARGLVEEAHGEAKQALAELRDLARGIHPAVLSDRGLDAALSALAARSPVPVRVSVEATPRSAPAIEAVAYFVVAEALTNVAKHSGATRADVTARRDGDRLLVSVTDNGDGGADIAHGSGLSGLRDRVRAVDGTLALDSPSGGPTTLFVELPCES